VFADPSLPPGSWGDPANWRESAEAGGSPGRDEIEPAGPRQLPGDLNQDATLDLSDAVRLLLHLFAGGLAPPCEGGAINAGGSLVLADFDGNAALEVTDAVAFLQYLFRSGPPHALGSRCLPIAGCPARCAP
jgi:hypothetical protein